MKKQILLSILVLLISTSVLVPSQILAQSQPTTPKSNADLLSPPATKKTPSPEPYNQENFAPWMYYMYRFGAVAVGSIPFTLMFATIAHDVHKTYDKSMVSGQFENTYLPLFLSGPEKPPYSDPEVQTLLWSTLALSLSVSVIDVIILVIRQQKNLTIETLFN